MSEIPSIENTILTCDTIQQKLQEWLTRSIDLSSSFFITQVCQELKYLKKYLDAPGFKLAFVGEWNRGKSTLINRLIGENILPVGLLPTTALITSLVSASESKIEIYNSDGEQQERPLSKESWSDILATTPSGFEQEVLFSNVRVYIDNPWLRDLDVEIIDTPGAGDPNTSRTTKVFEVMNQSDAAVLVVSATSPFSLTERIFLEEEVIGRHVPRVIVAVSMLDKIEEHEQQDILNNISKRINSVSKAIPVFPVSGTNKSEELLRVLREQINTIASPDMRRPYRNKQIALQLCDYLNQILIFGNEAIAAKKLDDIQLDKIRLSIQATIDEAEILWSELTLQLESRRIKLEQAIRNRVDNFKENLLGSIIQSLKQSQDPTRWWDEELPFVLRRELLVLSRNLELYIKEKIEEDCVWFEKAIHDSFDINLTDTIEKDFKQSVIDPNFGELDLLDVKPFRRILRLTGVAVGLLSIFAGPMGAVTEFVLGMGTWLVGEKILAKEIKVQHTMIIREINKNVDRMIDIYCMEISGNLKILYSKFSDYIKQQQMQWLNSKKALIKSEKDEVNLNWQELIDQVAVLKSEIVHILKLEET